MKKIFLIKVFLFIILFTNVFALFAADSINVKNAGMDAVNGNYELKGTFNNHPLYVKGDCQIRYKGCKSKWVILYKNISYYKNYNDSDICPILDWQMTCAAKKDSLQAPVLTVIDDK